MAKKRESREVWAKRVERWKDSDLTAEEFAAEVGVNAGTLKFWKYLLNKESKAADEQPGRQVRQRRRQVPKAPEFVEVTPRAETVDVPIDVVVGDLVVRVSAGFDEDTLRRILTIARSAS